MPRYTASLRFTTTEMVIYSGSKTSSEMVSKPLLILRFINNDSRTAAIESPRRTAVDTPSRRLYTGVSGAVSTLKPLPILLPKSRILGFYSK
jgi:hypothetical protein